MEKNGVFSVEARETFEKEFNFVATQSFYENVIAPKFLNNTLIDWLANKSLFRMIAIVDWNTLKSEKLLAEMQADREKNKNSKMSEYILKTRVKIEAIYDRLTDIKSNIQNADSNKDRTFWLIEMLTATEDLEPIANDDWTVEDNEEIYVDN
jgi:hypothetical protein